MENNKENLKNSPKLCEFLFKCGDDGLFSTIQSFGKEGLMEIQEEQATINQHTLSYLEFMKLCIEMLNSLDEAHDSLVELVEFDMDNDEYIGSSFENKP